MTTKIIQNFYISSGAKNAMYTLRYERTGGMVAIDNYVCNLSTDSEKAEAKAQEYFDRFKERVGENEYFKLNFFGYADFDLFERRGKLSVRETEQLEILESGIMPFGKNSGKLIADLPMSTVLWWADQVKETNNKGEVVFQAVAAYCLGVALENEYIAKREAKRAEYAEQDAKSNFVGTIKQRLEFEGTVQLVRELGVKQVSWNTWVENFVTKIVVGDDILVYFGNKIAEQGETIKFKATVKSHEEYKGVKQTVVNRPSVIKE